MGSCIKVKQKKKIDLNGGVIMAKSREEKATANRAAIENEIRNMELDPIQRHPKRKSKKFDHNNEKFVEDLNINDFE